MTWQVFLGECFTAVGSDNRRSIFELVCDAHTPGGCENCCNISNLGKINCRCLLSFSSAVLEVELFSLFPFCWISEWVVGVGFRFPSSLL